MQATHIDAFLASAFEVLGKQAQAEPHRGSPVLRSGATHSSRELTALVTIGGDLGGVVFYSMSLATGAKLGLALSQPTSADQPASAEEVVRRTAQIIVAGGVARLEARGCHCTASDPLVVFGFGTSLTTVSPVLTVPLFTQLGDMDIGIAMQPAASTGEDTQPLPLRTAPPSPSDEDAGEVAA